MIDEPGRDPLVEGAARRVGRDTLPSTVRPFPEDESRVRERWDEYGLGDLWTAASGSGGL